jgi:nucleotide-binding universal stress UspA family protein
MIQPSVFAGTDLSAPSRHAAQRAEQLAQDLNVRFVLANVVPDFATVAAGAVLPAQYATRAPSTPRRGGRSALESAAGRHAGKLGTWIRNAGVHPDARRVLVGKTHDALLAAAKAARARLIVTGVHRSGSKAKSLLLGTTTDRLLRKSSVPVLLVRRPPTRAYRSVLVAVDLEESSGRVIAAAREIAPWARIHLFHVAPKRSKTDARRKKEPATADERLAALASDARIPVEQRTLTVVEGDPREQILRFADRRGVDLVAVGTHGRKGFERLLLGSVAEHVLRAAPVDVLAVPPPRET